MITTIRPTKRAVALLVSASAALLSASLLAAPAARADDASTLTVVGTSDVYDSNLIQSVIKPGFEAANPGITLNYVSKGTGAAIDYAEQGTASALLVHAASLENQFVDQGYATSFGRAIFYGDFVLLGPASDPAGVLAGDSHDIVGAFEKIAAAGADGDADFVSRGGTPGTTVAEHKIWALTSGVSLCTVTDENGGGKVPTSDPDTCANTNPAQPSWYHTTGLTQGPNLTNANACNYGQGNDCYAFTDRGTFQYLQSETADHPSNEVPNLQIVTRDNSAGATGGSTLLVNSFHAYAIDPAKFADDPNVQINAAGAKKFLDFITSPDEQAKIGDYLADSSDGAPFLPDAAPSLSAYNRDAHVVVNSFADIHGTLANRVPGAPPLASQQVTLTGRPLAKGLPTTVQVLNTDAGGHYEFRFKPRATAKYTVSTDQLTQVEDPNLNPTFTDLLAPASTAAGSVIVTGRVNIYRATRASTSQLELVGAVGPQVAGQAGQLVLSGNKVGAQSGGPIARRSLPIGSSTFDYTFTFPKGKWVYRLTYANYPVIAAGTTAAHSFTSS